MSPRRSMLRPADPIADSGRAPRNQFNTSILWQCVSTTMSPWSARQIVH
jgi:hypothetical protein